MELKHQVRIKTMPTNIIVTASFQMLGKLLEVEYYLCESERTLTMRQKVAMPVRLPMPMYSAMSLLHADHTVISSAQNTRCVKDKCATLPWESSGTVIMGGI